MRQSVQVKDEREVSGMVELTDEGWVLMGQSRRGGDELRPKVTIVKGFEADMESVKSRFQTKLAFPRLLGRCTEWCPVVWGFCWYEYTDPGRWG